MLPATGEAGQRQENMGPNTSCSDRRGYITPGAILALVSGSSDVPQSPARPKYAAKRHYGNERNGTNLLIPAQPSLFSRNHLRSAAFEAVAS